MIYNYQDIENLRTDLESLKEQRDAVQRDINNFEIEDHINEEDIAEELADVYGDVELFGSEYCRVRIIRQIDPVMWRQIVLDWMDSVELENIEAYQELQAELDDLEDRITDAEEELEEAEEQFDELSPSGEG